jgi:hypothetical protein
VVENGFGPGFTPSLPSEVARNCQEVIGMSLSCHVTSERRPASQGAPAEHTEA